MTFDPARVAVADLLRTIRGLDYEPELVQARVEPPDVVERVDVATLPEELRASFTKATSEGRPILLEFSGPG